MIEHAPIFAIVLPLTMAFFIPIVSSKAKGRISEGLAIIGSLLSFLCAIIVAYAIWTVDKPIVYTLGADLPTILYKGEQIPVRILLEIDHLSALFGVLVSFEVLLAIIYSWGYMAEEPRKDKYYTLLLLSLVGMMGIVYTGDFFNMYVFLEILAISSYALVAFEKEVPEALEASIKYLVLGTISSTFFLVGVAIIYGEFDTLTMAMVAKLINTYGLNYALVVAYALFLAGLTLKAGIAPMHMWLIDAHPSAPSPFSMVLSGVIVKVAIYMFLRITFSVYGLSHINYMAIGLILIVLASISLIVAPLMATAQSDIKRLFAYSTVTELGIIFMGLGVAIATIGSSNSLLALQGSIFHIINHALYKGLLFLVAGALALSIGTRNLTMMSNIARKMPYTTTALIIGLFAIAGIPPLNGFASKWLIYEASTTYNPIVGTIVIIGSALTFTYMLKVILSIYAPGGMEPSSEAKLSMLTPMIILAALCIIIGLMASHILANIIQPAANALSMRDLYINAVFNYSESALQWSEVMFPW